MSRLFQFRLSRFKIPTVLVSLLAMLAVTLAPASTALAATVHPTPLSFPTVNGKVLAMTVNANKLIIGGHFTSVKLPNGNSVAATNLATIDLANPNNVHGFNVDGIVWALCSTGTSSYLGGDFLTVNGASRNSLASFNATSYAVSSWHPANLKTIRGCAGYGGRIAVAHGAGFDQYTSAGAHSWHLAVTGGGGATAAYTHGALYLGGLFDSTAQADIHGLVKVNYTTGIVDKAFNVGYRDNTHVGAKGSFDGDCIISLAAGPDGLIVGSGGAHRNGIWNVNYATGGYATGKKWGASRARITAGDAQAVAWTGKTYLDGQHRNHVDGPSEIQGQMRYLTSFTTTGTINAWDLGLWGHQTNDGDNGGVRALRVVNGVLYVGGSFLGWGNYDATDWAGQTGPNKAQGLIAVPTP